MLPASRDCLAHNDLHALRSPTARVAAFLGERVFVTQHYFFQHPGRRYSGKVRSARGHGERQSKPDQIMRGVANHRLVEIADLNVDLAVFIGYGAKVSNV